MLRDPDIVEAPAHADAVCPGMIVTVRPLDDDEPEDETYLLAEHAEERAPGCRTVTITSPFGSALIGASEGEEVVVPGAWRQLPLQGGLVRAVHRMSRSRQ